MKRAEFIVSMAFAWGAVLFITVFGAVWLMEGVERGERLAQLDPRVKYTLVVERKTPRPGQYSGESHAHGKILETGETASVAIFSTQYDVLGPGGHLEVYRLTPSANEFVFRRKYEESLPLMSFAGNSVSWHFPGGLIALAIAVMVARELLRAMRAPAKAGHGE